MGTYEEWVVAGIKFYDYDRCKEEKTLFSIYIYNFREGFKIVDVTYAISEVDKEIILDFVLSDR